MSEHRHARVHHYAVEIIWLTGDTEYLESVEDTTRQRWLPLGLTNFGADVRLSLARLCAINGRVDEAARWFAQARNVFTEQGARPLLAIADHDEAWMHIRHPGNADATTIALLLERGTNVFREIGMPGWLTRSQVLQADLNSRTRDERLRQR